jgi:uncharacterized phage protein gp47/JayE
MSLLVAIAGVPTRQVPEGVEWTVPNDCVPYDEIKHCINSNLAMTQSTACGSTGYQGNADSDYDDRDK